MSRTATEAQERSGTNAIVERLALLDELKRLRREVVAWVALGELTEDFLGTRQKIRLEKLLKDLFIFQKMLKGAARKRRMPFDTTSWKRLTRKVSRVCQDDGTAAAYFLPRRKEAIEYSILANWAKSAREYLFAIHLVRLVDRRDLKNT